MAGVQILELEATDVTNEQSPNGYLFLDVGGKQLKLEAEQSTKKSCIGLLQFETFICLVRNADMVFAALEI